MKITMEDKGLSLEMEIKDKEDINIIHSILKKTWNKIEEVENENKRYKKYGFIDASRAKKQPEKQKNPGNPKKTKKQQPKPKPKDPSEPPDKGRKIKTHNGAGIFINILNDIKDKNVEKQLKILRKYYPDLKSSTLNSYQHSYKGYINRYINKLSPVDIAKKRRENKWKALRGPVVDYYKSIPIHKHTYAEVKKLQRSGRLKAKAIKPIISKFMPDASPNTIKAYANGYKKYTLSPKEPNQRKYDNVSDAEKKKVLNALHKVYTENRECNIDNILKEVDLTSTKTGLCLAKLIKEEKVKKDNSHYFLKYKAETRC